MDTEEESIVYSVMEGEHRPILERLPSHTIHGLFNYMVNLNNHEMNQKPAIIYKDATITFEELNGYTNNLAALLRKMLNIPDKPYSEISRTPIIGVHMHPSEKVVVVLLAVLKMGAAYVPLDPDYPIQRLQHIMKDSQPICILASQGTPLMKKQREDTSKNLNSKGDILCIDDMWTETIDPSWSPENYPEADNDNIRQSPLACILYTSGRTGVPKGVCLSHESILHRLAWQWKTFPFKENDIGCLKTTLNFVDSLSETFGFILQGRPTVPIDKDVTRDPEQLLSVLHAHKVTRITVVPSLLSSILSMVSHNSDSRQILDISQTLKFWVCSGEELPSQLLKDFFTFFPEGTLANFYGSTEVTGDVTYATFKKESSEKIESRVPIGIPMFNTNIYVLDENLQPVPIGDVGSIYVSGRNLAVAYFNDKDETSQGFFKNNLSQSKHHERLYKMGDFGRMVFDQTPKHFNQRLERRLTLIFEGSEHAQVKIRGKRVNLHEIEVAIREMPGIEGVRVHCYEQSSFDRTLVAFYKVCPIEVCTPSLGDMKEDLKKILPSYMIPEMVSVKDWPLLPNGKINNDALRSTFDEHRSSRQNTSTKHTGNDGGDDNASLKPTLSYEQSIIIALISQTLNIPEDLINLESNFFELGGNSVNGVKVVSRLRGMGMHITVDGFFKSTSVHDIASQVSHGTNIELDLTNDSIASEWERRILQDFDIVHFSETTDDNVELALELLTIETTTLSPYNAVMLAKGFSYEDIFLASYQAAKSCVDTPEGPELSFFIKRKCNGEIVGVYANYAASSSLHLTDLMIQVDSLFFQFADNLEEECLQTMDVSYGNNYVYGHLLAVKDGPMPLKLDLVRLMEKYLCDYARKSGFKSIWTFNDHPLTQVVSRETGYVVHGRKRFRDFCHDGQRVFENIQPSYLELEFATKDL